MDAHTTWPCDCRSQHQGPGKDQHPGKGEVTSGGNKGFCWLQVTVQGSVRSEDVPNLREWHLYEQHSLKPQFIKILQNFTNFKYLVGTIGFSQAVNVLKMRWILKQLMSETIQLIAAATLEINCKMFIDLTGQSCVPRLHRNHCILECLSGHGPQ